MPPRKKRQSKLGKLKKRLKRIRRYGRSLLHGRLFHLTILIVCLVLVVPPFIYPPDKIVARQVGFRWKLYCFFDDHYGLHSPFGALVRSFSYCARGKISKALDYYMLGPILLLYLMIQVPYRLWAIAVAPQLVHRNARLLYGYFTGIVFILILMDWLFMVGGRTF